MHGAFNFGYQFWFFWALQLLFFTKLMLCNIILKINPTIYIERSMCIFIVHIGIIGPLFCFECTNFKASLVIKIINCNGIKNMAHLAMLVIFHVNVIFGNFFNLPYIYHIFVEKIHFWDENLSHGIQTWFKLCEMTWFNIPSIFRKIKNHLIFFGIYLCFWIHMYTTFISTNIFQSLTLQNEMDFLKNIFPKLYSNIVCNFFVKIF